MIFNPFQSPIKKSMLEVWAKMLDDFTKIAILAMPVTAYSNVELSIKFFNLILLCICVYCSTVISINIRNSFED
ncbi:Uncharacterised protein [Actinobacillus ureae]|nr:Uncharacterised protein [Actinobacillus ureae]SUU46391.1 Uncharacterised protein [Actinobacillus ureae]